MPGYANWRTLYQQEYLQLKEEGYQVGDELYPQLKKNGNLFINSVNTQSMNNENNMTESDWEKAYHSLWKLREKGLRPDYPFVEPNGYDEIIEAAAEPPILKQLDERRYAEKIKGAFYGRCAGVVLGKPLEMDVNRLEIKEFLESVDAYPLQDWVPAYSEKLDKRLREDCVASTKGNVEYVQPDDDIHYTILALLLVEKKGLDFSTYDVGVNIQDNIPYNWLWSTTKQAYYHMCNMVADRPFQEQVDEFTTKLNPMREGINGTIRADIWGYISPGDPRRAAKLAHQEASYNTCKNGLYGSMFTAACISSALSMNPTIETILQGGLSVIPKKSRLAKVVEEVSAWYAKEKEWIPVCDKIYEKYGHLPFAGGINNLAFIILSLLHGQLDYTKTITTAVMCGTDTDCTSGTAASIVGAAIGYDKLDQKWIAPLNDRVKTVVADFGEGSISDIVKRIIAVRNKHNS
ncbi:MAG TPA: ADP-ribosylglycohydrolase family protein [Ruminiclostridium sp.]